MNFRGKFLIALISIGIAGYAVFGGVWEFSFQCPTTDK